MMKVIDLFSGCGGLSLGFQNANFEIVAAFDQWEIAVKVYQDNFNHAIYDLDLSDEKNYEYIKSLNASMIIGGPPCQDFSSAGKRDETLGRADLTLSFAKIISQTTPEWFVMENVERIVKSNVLRKAVELFKSCGYGLSHEVLDASYCGVPQSRKRFFLIGHLHSNDAFLNNYLIKKQSKQPMTVFDYLGDSLGTEHYYRHPRSYKRRGVFSIYEPSPTIRGVNRPIPKGYQPHEGDSADISCARPLTTIERSYLQTFPKSFVFQGNKTDLEQVIGNAVPVKLAEYVASCIQDYIMDQKNMITRSDQQLQLFA